MRIGELADQLGLNPKTIRYYENIGLLPEPERTPSGYRDYNERTGELVTFIKTAQRAWNLARRDPGDPRLPRTEAAPVQLRPLGPAATSGRDRRAHRRAPAPAQGAGHARPDRRGAPRSAARTLPHHRPRPQGTRRRLGSENGEPATTASRPHAWPRRRPITTRPTEFVRRGRSAARGEDQRGPPNRVPEGNRPACVSHGWARAADLRRSRLAARASRPDPRDRRSSRFAATSGSQPCQRRVSTHGSRGR